MYSFERSKITHSSYLKKKFKNKVHINVLICNTYIIEEISIFISYYFEPHLKTRIICIPKHDDGGECLQVGICQYFTIPDDLY